MCTPLRKLGVVREIPGRHLHRSHLASRGICQHVFELSDSVHCIAQRIVLGCQFGWLQIVTGRRTSASDAQSTSNGLARPPAKILLCVDSQRHLLPQTTRATGYALTVQSSKSSRGLLLLRSPGQEDNVLSDFIQHCHWHRFTDSLIHSPWLIIYTLLCQEAVDAERQAYAHKSCQPLKSPFSSLEDLWLWFSFGVFPEFPHSTFLSIV